MSVDASGASGEELLTRVTGGAFAPAPTPDGKTLFFLDFAGRGVSVRRLALGGAGLSALDRPADAYPLLPPRAVEAARFGAAPVPEARPYSVWPTQAVRPLIDFSFGPSGNTVQPGVDSADVLGRLHLLAMGSFGNAVGPRGGSVAAAWRGWPVALALQLFAGVEKPGNQGLAPRPQFDEERWGGYLGADWARPFSWGRVEARAGGGATDVEVLETGRIFGRTLGSAGGSAAWRRTRDGAGFGFDLDADGSLGVTDGYAWTQWAAGGRAIGILPFASLSAGARYGDTGGRPTRFDDFAIGGASSAILPPGLDRNRIQNPALPADLQVGLGSRPTAWSFRATRCRSSCTPTGRARGTARALRSRARPGDGRRGASRQADSPRVWPRGHVPRGRGVDRERRPSHPGRARICSAGVPAVRRIGNCDWRSVSCEREMLRKLVLVAAALTAACASQPKAAPAPPGARCLRPRRSSRAAAWPWPSRPT